MKKILYGTSALVMATALTASPAAAQIELGVGGYMNLWMGIADDDAAGDRNAAGILVDGEVHFKGSYKHDNGLEFTARIELEAFNANDQIDKVWAQVAGSFGTIRAGRVNDVASAFLVSAPQAGMGISTGWVTTFIPVATANSTFYVGTYQSPLAQLESSSISYRSPRFGGFQVGVTYAPSVTVGGAGDDTSTRNFTRATEGVDRYNALAVALNFSEEFNGVGVSAALGYSRNESDTAGFDDWQHMNAGLNLSYMGFTVGGSYFSIFDDGFDALPFNIVNPPAGTDAIQTDGSDYGFDVGLTYSTGPWTVGVVYIKTLNENNASLTQVVSGLAVGSEFNSEDIFQAAGGGVSYAIAPGINLTGNVFWQKTESDFDSTAETLGFVDSEVEGFGATFGMTLGF